MRNPGHTSLGAQYREMLVSGNLVLAAGTTSDATQNIDAHSSIWPQRITGAGTQAFLSLGAVVPGVPGSYAINTSNVLDVSTLRALILTGGGHFDNTLIPLDARNKLTPHAGSGGLQAGSSTSIGLQVGLVSFAELGAGVVTGWYIPSGARFMLFHNQPGAAPGHLSWNTVVPGNPGTFTIASSDVGEDGVIQFAIIDPAVLCANQMVGGKEGTSVKALQVLRGTLVGGTVTIPGTFPTTSKSGIYVQRVSVGGGALGQLTVGTVTVGDPGSVVVSSSNAGDTSVVDVFVWKNEAFGLSL